MLFLSRFKVREATRHETYKLFASLPLDGPELAGVEGVTIVGRWHDVVAGDGVAIIECDDPNVLAAWSVQWNGVLDLSIVPVLDDAAAQAAVKDLP